MKVFANEAAPGEPLPIGKRPRPRRSQLWAKVKDEPDAENRRWRRPRTLHVEYQGQDLTPAVALSAGGRALVIWRSKQRDAVGAQLCANAYTVSDGWSTHELIFSDAISDIGHPRAVMDAEGRVTVVWRRCTDAQRGLWACHYAMESGWTSPRRICREDLGEVFDPRLSINGRGDVMVVWQRTADSRNEVWSTGRVPGGDWSEPVKVSRDNVSDASAPQVALDARGNALVVWRQFDGTSTGIWSNRFSVESGWGRVSEISADRGGTAFDPQVAVCPGGDAVTVWTQASGPGRSSIHASHYTAALGWRKPECVSTQGDELSLLPSLSVNENGYAVVAWDQSDGRRSRVMASHYRLGSGWAHPTPLDRSSESDMGTAFGVRVAMDAEGGTVAVWQREVGTQRAIRGSSFSTTHGWTSARSLTDDVYGNAFDPQVAIAPQGYALAVWQTRSDSGCRLHAGEMK